MQESSPWPTTEKRLARMRDKLSLEASDGISPAAPHPPQPEIPAWLWWSYQLYKWLIVIPVMLFSTFFFCTIIILFCFAGLPEFSSKVFGTLWARLNAFVTLMNISVYGKEKLRPGQSYVLVANHLSLLDIYVLYGFSGLDLKWVIKKELRKIPVLGLACELMGHIYVDRSNTESALASIETARHQIQNGMCVIFFPEGTRSRTQELRPFKKGAFGMARDLGIPVVPVSIHNTNRILPSDGLDWRPGAVQLRFHDPVLVDQDADLDQLAVDTRSTIVDALNAD